jgi:hypothetical protein
VRIRTDALLKLEKPDLKGERQAPFLGARLGMGVEEQKKLSTKVSASLILRHPVEAVKSAARLGSTEISTSPVSYIFLLQTDRVIQQPLRAGTDSPR